MNEEHGMPLDPEQLMKIFVIGKTQQDPENIERPKKTLTQYEKNQIEFHQATQALDVLVGTWKFIREADLLDEVDELKIRPIMVDKLAELLKRL